MRGQAGDLANIASRKRRIMETGFQLFSEQGIESVTMKTIAEKSGVPWTSMHRCFAAKVDLVIAIGAWKWNEYIAEYRTVFDQEKTAHMSAAEHLKWYLDAFLDLYRNHRDILCFNYAFNSYLRNEKATEEQEQPYLHEIELLRDAFHRLYEKGLKDGTINRNISEEEMFSSSFHIMLAVVTRCAVGLVYVPPELEASPERELERLKTMMLREYTVCL